MPIIQIRYTNTNKCEYQKIGDSCDDIFMPPFRATKYAVGYDVCSSVDLTIHPGRIEKVPTGIAIEAPPGIGVFLAPRSSLGARNLLLTNGWGIIDPDYRGEILASFRNLGEEAVFIGAGDRIAQLLAMPFFEIDWRYTHELQGTERPGGFGSTGV